MLTFHLPYVEVELKEEERNGRVLVQLHGLQATLSKVTTLATASGGALNTAELLAELQLMQQDVDGVSEFVSLVLPPRYYNERRGEDSRTASEVFAIPELLELILIERDVEDILNMTQVNRRLKTIIDESSPLQIKLCLKAADTAHTEIQHHATPSELDYAGFKVQPGHNRPSNAHGITAEFLVNETTGKLPHIGEKWSQMFFCQPPIESLNVYRTCPTHGPFYSRVGSVKSERGLTIGVLYDEAEKVLEMESECGMCREADRESDDSCVLETSAYSEGVTFANLRNRY